MQKKYFLVLLTIIGLLTLVGCAGLGEPPEKEETTVVEDANDVEAEDEAEADDEDGDTDEDEVGDGDAVDGADDAEDTNEEPVAGEPATVPREIFISGSEFNFNPSSISLTAGESVKITFKNDGKYPHDFAIEGLNVKTAVIGAGEQAILELTAPATGTYATYCSVAGHREAGMEGSVSVQ